MIVRTLTSETASDRLFSLLPRLHVQGYQSTFEDDTPPLTPYTGDDPVDIDSIYTAQCLRREASVVRDQRLGQPERQDNLPAEGLFLSGEVNGVRLHAEDWKSFY